LTSAGCLVILTLPPPGFVRIIVLPIHTGQTSGAYTTYRRAGRRGLGCIVLRRALRDVFGEPRKNLRTSPLPGIAVGLPEAPENRRRTTENREERGEDQVTLTTGRLLLEAWLFLRDYLGSGEDIVPGLRCGELVFA
jgi:hypothetical protein